MRPALGTHMLMGEFRQETLFVLLAFMLRYDDMRQGGTSVIVPFTTGNSWPCSCWGQEYCSTPISHEFLNFKLFCKSKPQGCSRWPWEVGFVTEIRTPLWSIFHNHALQILVLQGNRTTPGPSTLQMHHGSQFFWGAMPDFPWLGPWG